MFLGKPAKPKSAKVSVTGPSPVTGQDPLNPLALQVPLKGITGMFHRDVKKLGNANTLKLPGSEATRAALWEQSEEEGEV